MLNPLRESKTADRHHYGNGEFRVWFCFSKRDTSFNYSPYILMSNNQKKAWGGWGGGLYLKKMPLYRNVLPDQHFHKAFDALKPEMLQHDTEACC